MVAFEKLFFVKETGYIRTEFVFFFFLMMMSFANEPVGRLVFDFISLFILVVI